MTGIVFIVLIAVLVLALLVFHFRALGVRKREKDTSQMVSQMRVLTAAADSIATMVQSPEEKEIAREVADLLRYSDPVSVPGLSEVEGRIQDVMKLWKQAAEDKDRQQFLRRGQKLKDLITERNNQCLALKRAK